jgi:hypothetical protein
MDKEISRWHSSNIEQGVQLVRWGHYGTPGLLFPTAGGDAEDVRDVRGSGLGLAIVQQVAEAHGGRTVAEPADGGGMVMALQLPLDGRQA